MQDCIYAMRSDMDDGRCMMVLCPLCARAYMSCSYATKSHTANPACPTDGTLVQSPTCIPPAGYAKAEPDIVLALLLTLPPVQNPLLIALLGTCPEDNRKLVPGVMQKVLACSTYLQIHELEYCQYSVVQYIPAVFWLHTGVSLMASPLMLCQCMFAVDAS
jgi:hypothetical protein